MTFKAWQERLIYQKHGSDIQGRGSEDWYTHVDMCVRLKAMSILSISMHLTQIYIGPEP